VFDKRDYLIENVLLGRNRRIEFRTDPVCPPASTRAWSDNWQAVSLELICERRLADQPIQMHAVEVQHAEAKPVDNARRVYITRMAVDRFFCPQCRKSREGALKPSDFLDRSSRIHDEEIQWFVADAQFALMP
jgi:hypothetical protein